MQRRAKRRYHSYLLRLWKDGDHTPWRASLEDPHNGTQLNFAELKQLIAYLEKETGEELARPGIAGVG
jgi:hypothetical protein